MTEEFSMVEVCDKLRARGVPAYVEQTGGGCATIYAGTPVVLEGPDAEEFPEYPVMAGPGMFYGPGWTDARGLSHDFYVGPSSDFDDNIPTHDVDETVDAIVEYLGKVGQ